MATDPSSCSYSPRGAGTVWLAAALCEYLTPRMRLERTDASIVKCKKCERCAGPGGRGMLKIEPLLTHSQSHSV